MMSSAGLQASDATEQTQEVMAAVAQAINRWTPDSDRGKFRTWLYRVSRNILADYWKQTTNDPLTGMSDELIGEVESPIETSFDLEFERQVFYSAAQRVQPQVDPKTWQAFWQSVVEQQPVEKISKSLSMTTGSIYVARSRVMKRLQDAVRSFLKSENED